MLTSKDLFVIAYARMAIAATPAFSAILAISTTLILSSSKPKHWYFNYCNHFPQNSFTREKSFINTLLVVGLTNFFIFNWTTKVNINDKCSNSHFLVHDPQFVSQSMIVHRYEVDALLYVLCKLGFPLIISLTTHWLPNFLYSWEGRSVTSMPTR